MVFCLVGGGGSASQRSSGYSLDTSFDPFIVCVCVCVCEREKGGGVYEVVCVCELARECKPATLSFRRPRNVPGERSHSPPLPPAFVHNYVCCGRRREQVNGRSARTRQRRRLSLGNVSVGVVLLLFRCVCGR